MSTQKTTRSGKCQTTSQRRRSPVSATSSAPYKKMKSNLEQKLRLAQREIQNLRKQLQSANKKQRSIAQQANKKEQLLKSGFAKKQRGFQQNFKKRIQLIEQKWQHQLDNKINDVKQVAFKRGVKEGERCIRQIAKKFDVSSTLKSTKVQAKSKKSHGQHRSTQSKRRSHKRVA